MRAIDVHVHPSTKAFSYSRRWGKEVADFLPQYCRVEERIRTDEEMAKEFRDYGYQGISDWKGRPVRERI